jgi:hypothetical protein
MFNFRPVAVACAAVFLACWPASAQSTEPWPPLPTVNLANYRVADFADDELEIPYHLKHFAQVAGAVVETGSTRGFLNIAVNREPVDNQPYNARIQEMNVALSYFYSVNRPWNPYYRHPAVKVRLEAMLDYWCKIQNPTTGYFSEYSPTNWSLAPTGFGVLAMSRTLERLSGPDAPPFDQAILDRTFAAQRKAIMALLTNNQSFAWGREYSNQWTGVLRAAASYLKLRSDPEMSAAFTSAVLRATTEFQSPTGFLYEQGGPDFGYSSVNVQNVRLALPLMMTMPDVIGQVLDEHRRYGYWLAHNLVHQPGSEADFFTNAGVNTRTSHAFQSPAPRPVSQFSVLERAFAETTTEAAARIAARRASLTAGWPNVPNMTVPSAYSYLPSNLFMPSSGWTEWAPTPAVRSRAIASFPYLTNTNFTRIAYDPRGDFSYLFVRRPSYYAIHNSGKIRIPGRQVYGLGLLWSPTGGTFVQSVAATGWVWGTRRAGDTAVIEAQNLTTNIVSSATSARREGGIQDLPNNTPTTTYTVSDVTKKVTFNPDSIVVEVSRPGAAFSELIPLVRLTTDTVTNQNGRVTIQRGSTRLTIDVEPTTASISLGSPTTVTSGKPYQRVLMTVSGNSTLKYTIRLAGN